MVLIRLFYLDMQLAQEYCWGGPGLVITALIAAMTFRILYVYWVHVA